MGCTLEVWAGSVEAVVAELREPTIDPVSLRVDPLDPVMVDVVARWPLLAASVAAAADTGGGTLTDEMAGYVVGVVRHLMHHVHALSHTASGGEEFREDMARQSAALLGGDLLVGLLSRELAGLVALEVPSFGWAAPSEVQAAALAARTAAGPDTSEDIWQLVDEVDLAARRGHGLVGLYL